MALGYVAAGVLAGCYSAYLIIQSSGVEPVAADSQWLSRAAGLAGPSGYYVRLHYLMEGRLPPAPGQLTEATAERDKDGEALSGACRYRITSSGPLPRWWSLAVTDAAEVGASLQSALNNDTAIREADGAVSIILSQTPQPGNWLRAPGARRLTLLYSSIQAGGQRFGAPPPFVIDRERCR